MPDRAPKVLIVDDERNIAELLAVILEHSGFQAQVCFEGRAAEARCAAWRPDLLLMDVVLPDGDGLDFAAAICVRHPEIHAVIFSGQADLRPIAARMKRMGCAGMRLMSKPVHPDELLAELREMMAA